MKKKKLVKKAVKKLLVVCPVCNGRGLKDSNTLCPVCNGSGKVEEK